jgi:DNA-3-methyladenine glycosylase II
LRLPGPPKPLTEAALRRASRALAARDADLGSILARLGPPPLWAREPGFPTLVHIILEQQVSLASARAAFERLKALAAPLTPRAFLALDDKALRAAGFSRQKTAYCRHLAASVEAGELDLESLGRAGDEEVRAALLKVKGVGPWTADIYLLMALRRPDVWPSGDLALAVAAQRVKRLPARPTPADLEALAQDWRPFRAVAARLLWHFYLSRPPRPSPNP